MRNTCQPCGVHRQHRWNICAVVYLNPSAFADCESRPPMVKRQRTAIPDVFRYRDWNERGKGLSDGFYRQYSKTSDSASSRS